jgi:hypothetical protein
MPFLFPDLIGDNARFEIAGAAYLASVLFHCAVAFAVRYL